MTTKKPLGHLATPLSGTGSGVLVLHAWWGLNNTIKNICDNLAKEGFVAFAPDLYQGNVTDTISGAETLASSLDDAQSKVQLIEAIDFLMQKSDQNKQGLTVIGFSLGAYFALYLANAHPNLIHSVVTYYGTGEANFENATADFLCHFAEDDEYEPQENIDYLKNALQQAERPATFHIYPNTGHWFCEPDRSDAYNQPAADLAWERTLTFLQYQKQ